MRLCLLSWIFRVWIFSANRSHASKYFRHGKIIWAENNKSDYIVPIRRFDRNYNIVITETSFWNLRAPPTADIDVYTDALKTEDKFGTGVFLKILAYRNHI